MKLGLVSLGCDKNTVDSERILAALASHGAEHTSDLREADFIVVNTCGFIDAAKQESIDTLLEMEQLKLEGRCRAVVAVGCLVERYRDELQPALPGVDMFVGLRDMDRLVPQLQERGLIGQADAQHPGSRLPLGIDRHISYLKVSEGCDHGCAFCAIPIWRGRHRSFRADALVAEAQRLEAQGTVELNLVAQDLAHYGTDHRDGPQLVDLLRRLLDETSIPWLRLLYIYSAGIREPLLELMANEPRLLSYLDMPIQHASDAVLERMRRPEREASLRRKIMWMRDAVPELILRTTVMVGFPGETDADFRILLDFLEETRFDHLGSFAFSPQPDTRAAALTELMLPPAVGRERLEELVEVQRAISAERMADEVGRRRLAIVDRSGAAEAHSSHMGLGCGVSVGEVLGRIQAQADDVDGVTTLRGETGLAPGTIVRVEITGAGDYDLEADVVEILRPVGSPEPAADGVPVGTRRRLPMAPLGLESVWGR